MSKKEIFFGLKIVVIALVLVIGLGFAGSKKRDNLVKEIDLKDLPPITAETLMCGAKAVEAQTTPKAAWYGGCSLSEKDMDDMIREINTAHIQGFHLCNKINKALTSHRIICGLWTQDTNTGAPKTFTPLISVKGMWAHRPLQFPQRLGCDQWHGWWIHPANSVLQGKREWGQKTGELCTKSYRNCCYFQDNEKHEISSCYVWCQPN